jgi:formamidopyrimidine-DNA glycosylase
MPELPEVETIRRQLVPIYLGETIDHVKCQKVRIFQNVTPEKFARSLTARKILDISRYGKFCIFYFDGVYAMFHLGMSGIFLNNKQTSLHPQHIHIEIHFASGKSLYFQDVRKFGKVWLFTRKPEFANLGIDPTTRKFTLNNFRKLVTLKQMNIKFLLMNQSVLAGIGNIYANEVLFNSRISPLRKSNELTEKEISNLYSSIKLILGQAIVKFGTSYSAYRTVSGDRGSNQNFLKVYQRAGQACYRCGRTIKKIVMGSRSTFYCPNCQK